MNRQALIFGATGVLGAACVDSLRASGSSVVRASRNNPTVDVRTDDQHWVDSVSDLGALDAVVWASGCNWSDNVTSAGDGLEKMLEGNVLYVAQTMSRLLRADVLREGSALVVISSVWQETSRRDKFSYSVSKAALAGLVRSAVADLWGTGIRVNAVLPGPVDSEMTRRNLSEEQLSRFQSATPLGRLVSATNVAEAVAWLASPLSAGVNGQSLVVDGGWLGARDV